MAKATASPPARRRSGDRPRGKAKTPKHKTKETSPPKHESAWKHEINRGFIAPFLLTRSVHFHAAIWHNLSPPLTIGSGQLTDLAGGHKKCAADIASLPLHPVGLGRVENVVAIADLHARIRVAFQQVRARRLQIPQRGVESDMSVFMGESRAQAVLPVLIPGQGSRDPHMWFPAGLE